MAIADTEAALKKKLDRGVVFFLWIFVFFEFNSNFNFFKKKLRFFHYSAVAETEAAFEIELEDGATDSPREFYYDETDCDDPHAGVCVSRLPRLNTPLFSSPSSSSY